MKLTLLILLLTSSTCLALLNNYLKMSKTDAVGNDIAMYECGEGTGWSRLKQTTFLLIGLFDLGFEKVCDIEQLAAHCNANPACAGFNSNGLLKSCTAGCDAGCCYDVTEHVDLYIRQGYQAPSEWQEKIDRGGMLFANPEPHFCFLPEIANGYLGTVAMSTALFQSGLFNGKVKKETKWTIPYLMNF